MKRCLIIDDHVIVRRGAHQLLAEVWPAAEFGEAAGVAAGRELLLRADWELVLLDINLPGGNGFELLAEARQRCPGAAVLVFSAYPEEEFATRAFKLGAAGYLTKASLADEMLLAVRRVLAGGKYVSGSLAEHLAAALGDGYAQALHETLSPRELEVLRQVAQGRSAREIAAALSVSESTVGTYRSRIADKLQVSTSVELTRYALKHGLHR